jgi:hypothetical protein
MNTPYLNITMFFMVPPSMPTLIYSLLNGKGIDLVGGN